MAGLPGQPGRGQAEERGFGCVGLDEVEPLAAQVPPQPDEGSEIGERRTRAGWGPPRPRTPSGGSGVGVATDHRPRRSSSRDRSWLARSSRAVNDVVTTRQPRRRAVWSVPYAQPSPPHTPPRGPAHPGRPTPGHPAAGCISPTALDSRPTHRPTTASHRSIQAWRASTAHNSWARSRRPVEVLVPGLAYRAGIEHPLADQPDSPSRSSAHGRRGPRSMAPMGKPNPILGRSTSSAGTWR